MQLQPGKIAILCLLAISCLSSVGARRRSRIDVPEQNSTIETATLVSASETAKVEVEKLEAPAPTTVPTTDIVEEEEEKVSESSSSEESPAYEDCDLDNISFEMITG